MSVKRSNSGSVVGSEDIRFELEKADKSILYAVIGNFNNFTYVHLRKYYNDFPSKFGISFKLDEWFTFIKYIQKDTSVSETIERHEVRKLNNGTIVIKSQHSEMELFVRTNACAVLLKRYI